MQFRSFFHQGQQGTYHLVQHAAYLLRGAALEDAWSSEGVDEDRDELLQECCVYGTVNVVVDTVA